MRSVSLKISKGERDGDFDGEVARESDSNEFIVAHGDATSIKWVPTFCDPQLFVEHKWLCEPTSAVRTFQDMIPIHHDIVGRGITLMELAFSINWYGLVDERNDVVVYKELMWVIGVRQC